MEVPAKEFIFGSIFLLANKLQLLGDAVLEEITLKQWFLLAMIHSMENKSPSVSETAEYIGSSRQNVRKMLDTLAAKGYVSLAVSEADKRNLSISLTAQTEQFFTRFEAKGAAFLEELFEGVEEESLDHTQVTFARLFQNLIRLGEAYGKDRYHL